MFSNLENFALDEPALDYLSMQDLFTPDFLKFLEKLRFTGDVWALPEGQLFFKDNPFWKSLRRLLKLSWSRRLSSIKINLQSLIATKAAKCVFMPQASGSLWISLYAEPMESMPG